MIMLLLLHLMLQNTIVIVDEKMEFIDKVVNCPDSLMSYLENSNFLFPTYKECMSKPSRAKGEILFIKEWLNEHFAKDSNNKIIYTIKYNREFEITNDSSTFKGSPYFHYILHIISIEGENHYSLEFHWIKRDSLWIFEKIDVSPYKSDVQLPEFK
jgi:hypothetical protein